MAAHTSSEYVERLAAALAAPPGTSNIHQRALRPLSVDDPGQSAVKGRIDVLIKQLLRQGKINVPRVASVEVCEERVRVIVDENDPSEMVLSPPLNRLLALANIVAHALEDGRTLTPRDIFYYQKGGHNEFPSMESCSSTIRLLGRLVRVPRHCLNIYSPSRGLVVGNVLVLTTPHCNTQVPVLEDAWDAELTIRSEVIRPGSTCFSTSADRPAPRFVLIVEKEAIFHQIVDAGLHKTLNCIVICGRGYPCLATRAFFKQLYAAFKLPALGLFDWNPHGLQILLLYAHGSASEPEAYHYAVPMLRGLGLLRRDIEQFGRSFSHKYQRFTEADVNKAASLRERHAGTKCVDLVAELDFMERSGFKLELEALNTLPDKPSDFLTNGWLQDKIKAAIGDDRTWPEDDRTFAAPAAASGAPSNSPWGAVGLPLFSPQLPCLPHVPYATSAATSVATVPLAAPNRRAASFRSPADYLLRCASPEFIRT